MKVTLILIALLYYSSNVFSSQDDLSDYDIDNIVDHNEFSFLPIKGSEKQGVFLFSKYDKIILGPASSGIGIRSVVVRLRPTAVDSLEYKEFIENNKIIDQRKNVFPEESTLCELTTSARRKLSDRKVVYFTSVLVGGYPNACSLVVKYRALENDQSESDVMQILNEPDAIALSYSLEVEQISIESSFDFHEVVDALQVSGQLAYNSENDVYNGLISDVTYNAILLPPSMFGQNDQSIPISIKAWNLFINEFVFVNKKMETALTEENRNLSITVRTKNDFFSVNLVM